MNSYGVGTVGQQDMQQQADGTEHDVDGVDAIDRDELLADSPHRPIANDDLTSRVPGVTGRTSRTWR